MRCPRCRILFAPPPLNQRMKKFIIIVSLCAAAVSALAAPIQITTPTVITTSGNYVLATDIASTEGAGIDIQANNVNLDLNGHTVKATGTGIQLGYLPGTTTGVTNVKVHDGAVYSTSSGQGVEIFGSYCKVNNLTITVGASGIGVNIEHGQFNKVRDCTIIGPAAPTSFARVALTTFLASNNTFSDCNLQGMFVDTFSDDSQSGPVRVLGNNTFSNIVDLNPNQ